MIIQIETEAHYQQVKAEMEALLQKATQGGGFDSLTEEEDKTLLRLSHQVKAYEETHYPMPTQPTTLNGMKSKMSEVIFVMPPWPVFPQAYALGWWALAAASGRPVRTQARVQQQSLVYNHSRNISVA